MLIKKHPFFILVLYSLLSLIVCQDTAAAEAFDQKIDRYDFKTTITPDTHNGFTIEYKNYYKLVTNTITAKTYCLVGFNQPMPEECQAYTSISIPVRNISVAEDSYVAIPFLELLDLHDSIIKTNTANSTSPCLSSNGMDTSTAVPDMVFSQQDATAVASYISFSGGDESLTPLKKASWLLYVAAFFDLELKAYSIYNQLSTNYNCHRDNVVSTYDPVPVAWTDYDAVTSLYTVHSDIYYSQLVQDAGGRLVATNAAQPDIFSSKNVNDRLGLAIALRGAEVIVDKSNPDSISYNKWVVGNPDYFNSSSDSFISQIQRIPAITNGQVYSVHRLLKNGNSDWFQRSHARPDLALLDLIHLIHAEYAIETTQSFPLWITPFKDSTKVTTVDESIYGGCSSQDMEFKAFEQSKCTIQSNAINRTMMRKTTSLSNGDKAGISVGTIVFGLLCTGAGIWLFRRYRRRQRRHQFYRMHEF